MTNSRKSKTPAKSGLPVNILRQEFVDLAHNAADLAADASDEILVAAELMVDLLSVAEMFAEHSTTHGRAAEIIEFCQHRALPLLNDMSCDDSQGSLLAEANDRWNEYLALLAPDERFTCRTPGGWGEDSNMWQGSIHSDDRHDCSATSINTDDDSNLETTQRPIDMAGILASLAGRDSSAIDEHSCIAASTHPAELETIDDPEMVAAYADDAQQCLAEMESSLLALESGHDAKDALRNFCRQLHTLKGASGTVGLSRLAKYLHDLESEIEKSSCGSIDVDRLLHCVDTVRTQLSTLGVSDHGATVISQPNPENAAKPSAPAQPTAPGILTTPVVSPSSSPATGNDSEAFVRVEASRLERLMDLLAELVMLRNRRETYVKSLRTIHRELNYSAARTRTLTSTVELSSPSTISGEEANHTETEKSAAKSRLLSRTLDEVSRDTAELGRSLQEICDPLSDDNSAVSHLIGQFRQELTELRRLPVGGLFQRLQRVIRDAARSEGKLVEVHFEGQGARAERAVQDRLFEPLLHLVRNAVSHGIDAPETRNQSGKLPVGRITLSAWSDATSLCIEVRDDGRGLNDEALTIRGRELGLLPPGKPISQPQLWKLIFHPGFSTKSSVSEISGRGVGMDVVDSWVKRLRGRIDVESVSGQGTTFRLHIPLRSAVEHAMVVRAGGQLFALPMHTVSSTSDSTRPMKSLSDAEVTGKTVVLSQLLGCRSNQTSRNSFLTLRNPEKPASPTHHAAGCDVTIAVDAIVGVEEVVVRSLPSLLQRNELFAGVTLSGRAETVLLLDVRKVVELCGQVRPANGDASGGASTDGEPYRTDRHERCVLVVDDSVVVRRSLTRKIRAAGYEVREATNGREALVVLNAGDVSAVVTDLDMPGMTGKELLQEIKRHKHLRTIPVTVLTSRDDEATLSEIRQLEPVSILNKPVTEETVSAILESLSRSDSAICRETF
jgi:chemotaxis protein histidine kinase CheA/ActR/RegA family two-component response regulator